MKQPKNAEFQMLKEFDLVLVRGLSLEQRTNGQRKQTESRAESSFMCRSEWDKRCDEESEPGTSSQFSIGAKPSFGVDTMLFLPSVSVNSF